MTDSRFSLSQDANGFPAPVVRPRDGGSFKTSFTTTDSARIALSGAASVISFVTTADCFYRLGGADVVATDTNHFWSAGMLLHIRVKPTDTHIAVRGATDAGTFFVSKWE